MISFGNKRGRKLKRDKLMKTVRQHRTHKLTVRQMQLTDRAAVNKLFVSPVTLFAEPAGQKRKKNVRI